MKGRGMSFAVRLALAAMLVQSAGELPIALAGPLEFTYRTIPYGARLDSVLSLASGATIREDSSLDFRDAGSYREVMADYFPGGCSYFLGFSACLNAQVARKFGVSTGTGPSRDEVYLYFARAFGSEGRFGEPDGSYRTVFSGLRDAISEQTGLAASSFDAEYTEIGDTRTLTLARAPARCAVWQTETRRILLLVRQNMSFPALTDSPIVLYMWRPGLRTYLRACNAQKEAEDATEREKAKGLGRGF